MAKQILITGGAGFIGSHLCDLLIEKGYRVRILDNLIDQVHGRDCIRPPYLHPEVELIKADVCHKEAVEGALKNVDMVYHFAARVGVGQSMYEIADYVQVNNLGTAVLLEGLIRNPVEKLIVASSMSIYGEGRYRNQDGEIVNGYHRATSDLKKGIWEMIDERGQSLEPVPTDEEKIPALSSVYALSKYDQERLCLITGNAYHLPTVALRFFNIYGPRQALSNPYTGVLAIFASRLLNDKPPIIYEDGNQRRDFINIHDVVNACVLAAEEEGAHGQVFNIGSGHSYTIREIAHLLADVMGKAHLQPQINHKYRAGDIRHCFADIGKAKKVLGFNPTVDIRRGLKELSLWVASQESADGVEMAVHELDRRGLTV